MRAADLQLPAGAADAHDFRESNYGTIKQPEITWRHIYFDSSLILLYCIERCTSKVYNDSKITVYIFILIELLNY